tara:strand:+ start:124 stop:741 length:618 start_codon:yes stop_codon:yes gene_type:complete
MRENNNSMDARLIGKTFYIYLVPGVKIGCTDNVQRRVVKSQGFTEYTILEEHSDIYEASAREIKLQKQCGYPVDKIPYYKSFFRFGSEAGKKGAKASQPIILKKYGKEHFSKMGKLGQKKSHAIVMEKYGKEHFRMMRSKNDAHLKSAEVCSVIVHQYTKDNKFIKTYKSISAAAREYNASQSAISNCLRGKCKTSCGYIWKYEK